MVRIWLLVLAYVSLVDAFLPTSGLRRVGTSGVSRRAMNHVATMSSATKPSFSLSKRAIEPSQVPLQKSWFQAWGFAEPEPPSEGKMGFSAATKKKGKGKGKAAPPRSGTNSKLFSKAPGDDLLTIFDADRGEEPTPCSEEEIAEWGGTARKIIDEALPRTGAVLLRGLPMRSPGEFSTFWNGYLTEAPALQEGRYNSLGPSGGRKKLSGIDLATNVPPQFLLLCHNEMCYNPETIGRIALYCVQNAPEGGESLIARNKDLTKSLPKTAAKFLKEHGGILYSREFYDARNPPAEKQANVGSWQEKCSLPDTAGREEAEEFFRGMGFDDSQMEWSEDGGLKLTNQHPGFVKDAETGEDVWWNIVHTGSLKAGDGTPFPKKMVSEIQKRGWEHTYCFKLQPGDWLMIDNMRLQHGRLPFVADPRQPRVLLTVYSHPMPAC